jgi:carbon-monoxide dehydrogenase iron sulfur subunit
LTKVLVIDPEKCAGCRTCEAVCSFYHEKEFNPAKSRIHVLKWEEAGLDVPMVCQQCESPVCETVCPVKAVSRDSKTSAMLIDYDICIGCRMCIMACPFGGPSINPETRKTIKCDLCDGDPQCAKFCPTGTIEYKNATKATYKKRKEAANKLGELIVKLATP